MPWTTATGSHWLMRRQGQIMTAAYAELQCLSDFSFQRWASCARDLSSGPGLRLRRLGEHGRMLPGGHCAGFGGLPGDRGGSGGARSDHHQHPTGTCRDVAQSGPGKLGALYTIFDDKRHPYYEHRLAA